MAKHKCTDAMAMRCANSALCHLCDGIKLFHDPIQEKKDKEKQRIQNKEDAKKAPLKTHLRGKKEGMHFEQRNTNKWNDTFNKKKKKPPAKPRLGEPEPEEETKQPAQYKAPAPKTKKPVTHHARSAPAYQTGKAARQKNSGAMWNNKGDIKAQHALTEAKERGTINSRGEKQITVPKNWLDKQAQEAAQEHRDYWYILIGYKGEEESYVIKPYDHEMELIYELQKARERIEELEGRHDA